MDKSRDSLGDRMKWYERRFTDDVLMPLIPILARVDGRSFHTFTEGLERPYDKRLSDLMIATTKFLVQETNARCGYVQSDEISLVWLAEDWEQEIFFGGNVHKMTSVIGSLASAYFNKELANYLPEKANLIPVFDNRVWQVPANYEAVNCFLWREQDATRNSLQMATRSQYDHKEVEGKDSADMHEMLFKKGINWNDYPTFFKRGTYVRRRQIERTFSTEELESLPPKHAARANPNLKIKRSMIVAEEFPPLVRIENREGVILYGEDPILRNESDGFGKTL